MSVTAVPLQPVKTSNKAWLWIGIVIAILAAIGVAWIGTRAVVASKGDEATYLAWNAGQPGVRTTASGLQYQLIEAGEGPVGKDGDVATISIEGRLRDGTIFQPRAGGPFPIQAFDPARPVAILGFLEALKLMNKGSRYRIWIPAKLGYDAIPGEGGPAELKGQLLIFDVDVTELQSAAEMQMQQMLQQQQMQQQMQEMQGNSTDPAGNGTDPAAGNVTG